MNSRNRPTNRLRESLTRLALYAAGLAALSVGTAASAASGDNGVRGVSSVAQASATIVNPTSLRTAELQNAGTDFGRASGLAVEPAAIVRRNCADDRAERRCNLVILDMP